MVGIGELIAGKLCALLERGAPRDLFDATQLPAVAGAEWGSARLRSLFVALAGTLNHPVYTYGPDRWGRIDDRAVREQLHPTLAHMVQPDANELREAAWTVLEPLLTLTAAEREYTDRLQTGDLRPELLFPSDPETAARLDATSCSSLEGKECSAAPEKDTGRQSGRSPETGEHVTKTPSDDGRLRGRIKESRPAWPRWIGSGQL